MQRKLLIVCPFFPPANGADCHRARVLAPLLGEHGWEAEVLAVEPRRLSVPMDSWLAEGAGCVRVHRAEALSLGWTRIPGLGTLTPRAKWFIKSLGDELLARDSFDAIYFSTTSFGLTTLGPYWKKRYGVPYLVDYQDPWITDYYKLNPSVKPPGGRLKYGISDWISRRQEPIVLRDCSGITSVSPDYPLQLTRRYPFFRAPDIVLPFPGSERDFERIRSENVTQNIFNPHDGCCHWVCMGVSGPIMFKVLGSLFRALAVAREENRLPKQLRLHFVGTSYAAAGKGVPVVAPLAGNYGLSDIVFEQTDRVPFSTALKCLIDADAILATGSNDATYNASKLLPYILAKKPFLAIFHEDSPASKLLREIGGATHLEFTSEESESEIARKVAINWLYDNLHRKTKDINLASLLPYTDRGQASLLADFLNETCLSSWS